MNMKNYYNDKLDKYLRSEINKEINRKKSNNDPSINVFGISMPLSVFDSRLETVNSIIDKYLIGKLLALMGINTDGPISSIIGCITEPIENGNSEILPSKDNNQNDMGE